MCLRDLEIFSGKRFEWKSLTTLAFTFKIPLYTIHYTVILRPSLFQRLPDDLSLLLLCRSPDQENKGGDIKKNKNQKKKLGDSLNAI